MTPVDCLRRLARIMALCPLLAGGPALAEDAPLIPPDEFVYCTVCHGVQMKGNPVIEAPRLSGMQQWYLERQLRAFRSGWRGVHEDDLAGIEMRPMAAVLSDEQITAAAGYVNAVSSEPPPVTITGDAVRGKALYSSCAACHGANAQGVEAMGGPALTGLNDWYLVTQLENFRNGVRGGHPGDIYGKQMRAAAATLHDDTAPRDVVSYINILQGKRRGTRP